MPQANLGSQPSGDEGLDGAGFEPGDNEIGGSGALGGGQLDQGGGGRGEGGGDRGGGGSAGGILERLRSAGYDTSGFGSEEDAIGALLDVAQRYEQAQPFIRHGREFVEHADAFSKWRQEKEAREAQEKAQQTQSQKKPGFEWQAPEFNPEWKTRCRWDKETGRYVPATEWDSPAVAEKLNAYAIWQQQAGDRIVREFPQLVEQALSGRFDEMQSGIQKMVEERVQAALAQYESAQSVRQFFEQKKNEFFQVDQAGQVLINPQTGQPRLTPKGEAFRQYMLEGRDEFGIADNAKLQRYAQRRLESDVAAGKFSAPSNGQESPNRSVGQTPEEIARQKKGEFLSRVVKGQRQPNRDGTIPAPDSKTPQNLKEDLQSIFNEEMERAGIKPQTG